MPDNFDQEKIEKAIREILVAIGEDPDRPGLVQTPKRVARSFREIFVGLTLDPKQELDKVFEEDHDELVAVRDIPVYSVCEHHLQVFHGKAHVAYIPNKSGKVTGISKLARLVDLYAKRPQIQERLTSQVANALVEKLDPQAVLVIVEAEHLCMTMRGIKKPGAITTTSAVRGLFRKNASSRTEALNLLLRGHL